MHALFFVGGLFGVCLAICVGAAAFAPGGLRRNVGPTLAAVVGAPLLVVAIGLVMTFVIGLVRLKLH